jgi:hypothetical protein
MGELAYALLNLSVLPFWLAMILAPRSSGTQWLLKTHAAPLCYAAIYAALVLVFVPGGDGHMGSLSGLREAFGGDGILLLAWVHFLAFDLFVGSWVLADAQDRGIRHLVLVPSLVLCCLFGPAGYASYRALRLVPMAVSS